MDINETTEGIDFPLLNYVKHSQEYIKMLEAQIQRLENVNDKSGKYIKSLEAHNMLLQAQVDRSKRSWKWW